MAKQTFTSGQVLTAAQMTSLQGNDYNWTVSAKTANYVLVAADAGTHITMNSATATTVTVNTSLFTAGDMLRITNLNGGGTCTITAGTATVTTAGTLILAPWASGTLYFTSAAASIFFPDAPTASGTQNIAIFWEQQTAGTEGGGFTAGSWVKRTLNTTGINGIAGCSIASSVVTLANPGTYYFRGTAPAFQVNGNQLIIANTSDATQAIIGGAQYNAAADSQSYPAFVEGTVTITASKNFELQHRCTATKAGNGLGAAQSITTEKYAVLYISRIS